MATNGSPIHRITSTAGQDTRGGYLGSTNYSGSHGTRGRGSTRRPLDPAYRAPPSVTAAVHGNIDMHNRPTSLDKLTNRTNKTKSSASGTQLQNPQVHWGEHSTPLVVQEHREMDLVASNETIDHLLQELDDRDTNSISAEDFHTRLSSDGTSLLLTFVVNTLHSKNGALDHSQLARVAAHAAVRHPEYLIRCLNDDGEAMNFLTTALATRPLPLREDAVCPMDTPYLIEDVELRGKLGSIAASPPSELRRMCTPFLECFYPDNWEALEQAVRRAPDDRLDAMISVPGTLHVYFQELKLSHVFSPPRWVDITHHYKEPTRDWEEEYTEILEDAKSESDTLDYIDPISELGHTMDTFHALGSEKQKRLVLAKLPSALAETLMTGTLNWVMAQLRGMQAHSIMGALEPSLFRQLINSAPKEMQHDIPNAPKGTRYYYRFRLQNAGKGSPPWTNTSAGNILYHWLQGWIPMIAQSDYLFTLIRQPSDAEQDPLVMGSTLDIPAQEVLEHYIFDVQQKKSKLIQFDFWFVSDCEDINNNGAQSFVRNAHLHSLYVKEVRNHHIWSMKMERFPQGLVPCVMLERSMLRDSELLITQEIRERALDRNLLLPHFSVEWITLGPTTAATRTMIKCIFAAPSDRQYIIKICGMFTLGTDEQYPVTFDYRPLVLPHPRTAAFDQELNQALMRHTSYAQSLTTVVLHGLPNVDPFSYIPRTSLLSGLPEGKNNFTMTYLLRHGGLRSATGTVANSPVERITTAQQGARIILHGLKTNAERLITFATEISSILPSWLEDDQLDVKFDLTDAERAARAVSNNSRQAPSAPTTNSTSPLVAPETTSFVSLEQWTLTMDALSSLSHQVSVLAGKLDRFMYPGTAPTSITNFQSSIDDAVSAITATMTSTGESINAHTTRVIERTSNSLEKLIDSNNGNVLKLCGAIDNSITSSETTLSSALDQVSLIARRIQKDTLLSASTAPTETHKQLPVGKQTTPADQGTPPPTPKTVEDQPAAVSGLSDEMSNRTEGNESPLEDLTRPRQEQCIGCGKLDMNIHQCDHCELPYHLECLVVSPIQDDDRYCPTCIKKLFSEKQSPIDSDHSLAAEGSGLTESSRTSESEASEFESQALPQPQAPEQMRALRPRKK